MKKLFALLVTLAMVFGLAACGNKPTAPTGPDTEKGEGVMTYAEYVDAAVDTEVVIEGYVQSVAYNAQYGNASLFVQDADGAYYVYRMPCDDEAAGKLTVGTKVKVSGYKGEWAGELEVAEGTATFEVLEGNWVAPATDVTAELGTDTLVNHMNKLVAFNGMTVEASTAADGSEVAFLYNWDGSGEQGSDLYFNVSLNGNTFNFCVESDECGSDTDVYKAVEALEIGQTVDLEGFLYWYNGANPHITKVTVK